MNVIESEKTIHDVLAGKSSLFEATHNRFGVDVVPGSYFYNLKLNPLLLKEKLSHVKDKYDFIILDSSPSLNDEALASIISSDLLFVIATPDYPTLSCSIKAIHIAKKRGNKINGIILNKVRSPKFEISLEEIEEVLNVPIVAKIKDDKNALKALFFNMPVPLLRRNSKISKEIRNLATILCGKEEKTSFLRNFFLFNLRKEEVNRQILKEELYKRTFD